MTHFICIGNKCWGRGRTPSEAIRNCRKARPTMLSGEFEYDVYRVGPEAWVDAMGNINAEVAPVQTMSVRYPGGRRTKKEKFDAPVPRLR